MHKINVKNYACCVYCYFFLMLQPPEFLPAYQRMRAKRRSADKVLKSLYLSHNIVN